MQRNSIWCSNLDLSKHFQEIVSLSSFKYISPNSFLFQVDFYHSGHSWLIQDFCLYFAAGASGIELLMINIEHMLNLPMQFSIMILKIISFFSFWDILVYCWKTSFSAIFILVGVFDALYLWAAERTGWGTFCWARWKECSRIRSNSILQLMN